VDIPADVAGHSAQDGTCRLVFLSRLHPKKGIETLFDAMTRLPSHFTLDIYGTGDASYVKMLAKRAALSEGRIRLHGHVEGAAKTAAFVQANLFVLPSHSENFGIVVAEALAHGLPVLTTRTTPWHDLEKQGCGRCIDLPNSDLVTEIMELAAQDLKQMGQRGRAWVRRDFSTASMVDAFARLYLSMAQNTFGAVTT